MLIACLLILFCSCVLLIYSSEFYLEGIEIRENLGKKEIKRQPDRVWLVTIEHPDFSDGQFTTRTPMDQFVKGDIVKFKPSGCDNFIVLGQGAIWSAEPLD